MTKIFLKKLIAYTHLKAVIRAVAFVIDFNRYKKDTISSLSSIFFII